MSDRRAKSFLFRLRALCFLGLVAVVAVILFLSPFIGAKNSDFSLENAKISLPSLFLFYFAIVLFFSGLFSTILFRARNVLYRDELELIDRAKISLRQGFLLSLVVAILFVMQGFRILVWWDGLLVLGGILMIELYFLAGNRN